MCASGAITLPLLSGMPWALQVFVLVICSLIPVFPGDNEGGTCKALSKGLVARTLRKASGANVPIVAAVGGPALNPVSNLQTSAKEELDNVLKKLFLPKWGEVDAHNSDVLDLAAAIGMVRHSIVSKSTGGQFSSKNNLRILLQRHGHVLRTHDGELFHYDGGVWRNVKDPPPLDMQNVCTIAEGLFHTLGSKVEVESTWDWDRVSVALSGLIGESSSLTPSDFIGVMVKKGKEARDKNKIDTKGKTYLALPLHKMADSVAFKGKDTYDKSLAKGTKSELLRMYTTICKTPLPKSRGWRFADTYVNESWKEAEDSPENNCYIASPYRCNPSNSDLPREKNIGRHA